MRRQSLSYVFSFVLLFGVICLPAQDVLTNEGVIQLVKAGLPDDLVIQSMETQSTDFDLGASALIKLKEANVPVAVIKAMMNRQRTVSPRSSDENGVLSNQGGINAVNNAVIIPRKTEVQIKTDEQLSSKDTKVGLFKCSVDEDVKIADTVVIARGTAAVCRVVSIDKGSLLTDRKGSMDISVDSVPAVDGTIVVLSYEKSVGGGRFLGPFSKGLKVEAGTILSAVVDEKVEIRPTGIRAEMR